MQTTHLPRTVARPAALAALAAPLMAVLLAAGPAFADGGNGGSDIPDYGAAQQVLGSAQVHDTVSRFLTSAPRAAAPAAGADGGAAGAPRSVPNTTPAPRFDLNKNPVPLYELTPDFVTGKTAATAQNALRLSYLASRVTAADGHQAAVLLAPNSQDHSWQLAGIRDGDSDLSLAERGTAKARTFTEPQIHAWYQLTENGTVEPLNQEATTGLGGRTSVTLAAYQKLVNGRYGDKLPGSAYDRKGLAGGYGLTQGQDQGQGGTASAQPVAAPAASASPTSWQPAAVGGLVLLAAVGGGGYLRSRRRRASAR
ncbi:hypothetical protein [Kitasatospora azatica]|uniref:hypothetical protein n=1 Tax=Kitasatospora azatica TaxID=58347 RepID=UPI00068A3173|nr:hypothetical protein [Kitasatospora azatica]